MKILKQLLLAVIASLILSVPTVYASFPVKNDVTTKTEQTEKVEVTKNDASISTADETQELNPTISIGKSAAKAIDEEMIILLVLWFFLGAFAAHRWYKGKPAIWNILFILTAGGCGIWAIIDLINILTRKF
ncbi:MAG: TM2 domain-containing protein [Bacteroidia bacterium]|nr:TM2 domain-containing protein [Bacteroidia bacterium]